jgi:tRNA(fMet)-specific endonuclease VapC
MSYLLDTNTCIAVMRQHPIAVQRMSAVPPGDCVVSTVTSYELFTGVEKCAKPAQERSKVEILLKAVIGRSCVGAFFRPRNRQYKRIQPGARAEA